ncbi:MAG TPA: CHAT domain-containing protein [Ktedonobacteraceae bacterium]|nr:CHAT domain-containing protein [Ktedonobacteraceae bacterium]
MSQEHEQTPPAQSSGALPPSQLSEPPPCSGEGDDDLIFQLEEWMAQPTPREQRRYLEKHLGLLDERIETLLPDRLTQPMENPQQKQHIHEAIMLLQDARRRGGTMEAIREAYINLYGGFVLDIPPWLEEVEQQLIKLLNQKSPEETAEARMDLLQDTLERTRKTGISAPELLATLHFELAHAWFRHPGINHALALETAIDSCKEVLRCYVLTHYPYQYAITQSILGSIYQNRIGGEQRENLERAIACFHEALRVLTPDVFPFNYAKVQNNLGLAYQNRISGEQRENLERAIACYQEALQMLTPDTFSFEYAMLQNNLGNAYQGRIVGEQRENLERAIACFHEALYAYTLETFPFEYARTQNNLGFTYVQHIVGERRENLEHAITCFHEALRVWTLEAFPFYYAMAQNNQGNVYQQRITGEPRENLERAILCQYEALRIWTLEDFPVYYAIVQSNLGNIYTQRIVGEKRENLERAITCYQEALHIYTLDAFPHENRKEHLSLAEAQAQYGNWDAVEDAYIAALEAEDLLVILGAGTLGRDAVLKEGRDAAIRLGYARHRLGQVSEAVVAMERGRARGLAEAMALDAADLMLIMDEQRRSHYLHAREQLIRIQADLHALSSQELDEATRRSLDLAYTTAYRQAKAAFDTCVSEIRAAGDPPDFLHASLDATTILHAAECIGPGHALVYVAATPWGGVAVAALSACSDDSSPAHFAALDLPDLTDAWVSALVETRLHDGSERLIGGFALAQMGQGFAQVCAQWQGDTLQAHGKALRMSCLQAQQESTIEKALEEAMRCEPFARLAKRPLATLTAEERDRLATTLDQKFLRRELDRCLKQLSTMVMQPLLTWLCEQGVRSLTLIPCGHLAAFPLAAIVLADGRSVGEILPTSIAPSARSLLQDVSPRSPQAGVYTLGDPHHNLPWSEAEALTISMLAQRAALPGKAHVKRQATRERLLTALGTCWMVDACCHGTFDQKDFLRSALHLAQGERLSMAEVLSHQADMRGLRLLLLSACQTALLDLQGARDEVHSLAAAMLQAGARAVLASQWPVDDQATYLLMVRFVQEWLPHLDQEPPASALAQAQTWLRTVTNAELIRWQSTLPMPSSSKQLRNLLAPWQPGQHAKLSTTRRWRRVAVRGRQARIAEKDAQRLVRWAAEYHEPTACPYADPYYWAGFQVIGW